MFSTKIFEKTFKKKISQQKISQQNFSTKKVGDKKFIAISYMVQNRSFRLAAQPVLALFVNKNANFNNYGVGFLHHNIEDDKCLLDYKKKNFLSLMTVIFDGF